MELNTLTSEIRENVGIITLNRPKALNAVSEEMLKELTSQTQAFDEDERINAIIFIHPFEYMLGGKRGRLIPKW